MKKKIVFFGTDYFASQILADLFKRGYDIVAIVTQADKPAGRKKVLTPPPVKNWCEREEISIPIFQPERASSEAFVKTLKELEPDLFVVISYGQLMKQNLLDVPKDMCLNIHPSLLPKYRGASPIQSAVLAGEKETAVSIMEMVLAMDAGPTLAVEKVAIGADMTYGELEYSLIQVAKGLLHTILQVFEAGKTPKKREQDESLVTFTKKITPADAIIDWSKGANEVHNLVRGSNPKPGAKTFITVGGKKQVLKIFRTKYISSESSAHLTIKEFDSKGRWLLSMPGGTLQVLEVQPENKRIMSAKDFINGTPSLEFV